jgi:uncharacterized membrane protein
MHHCSIVLGLVVLTFNNFASAQETASARPTRYAFTVVAAPDSSSTLVGGINDHDQISGWYVSANGVGIHSFILEDGEFSVFDFPGAISTSATGINDRAQVVGAYEREFDPLGRGFLYDRGQFTPLDVTFANVQGTLPAALNNQGSVVGTYYDGTWHGFLFQRGKFQRLDVSFSGAHDTAPLGINDQGVIVGGYFDASGIRHGFIYESGRFTKVDEPGTTETFFTGVNNRQQIVGWASGASAAGQQQVHSFVYERGRFSDFFARLPNVEIGFTQASAINDSGAIVGIAAPPQGGVITSFVARPTH